MYSFLSSVKEFSGLLSLLPSLSVPTIKEYPILSVKFGKCQAIVKEFNTKRFYMNDSCQKVILELSQTFKKLFISRISSSKRVVDIPQVLKELDIEYNRFSINITKVISQKVEDAFTKLLSYYDIKENQKEKSDQSLVERCKMIQYSIDSQKAKDTFLETGKFVSVLSISMLLPLIRDNITQVYKLLFNEKLRIRVDCVLMKDGHIFSCTDLTQSLVGDYQVVLDKNLQLLRSNFLKSLNRWTCPLESIFS